MDRLLLSRSDIEQVISMKDVVEIVENTFRGMWDPRWKPHQHREMGQIPYAEREGEVKKALENSVMATSEKDHPHLFHCTEYDAALFR